MSRIKIENVCFSRGGRPILKDISLDIAPGGMTGVIGPNGAGKTSLLRLIAGLTAPDRGQILIGDQPLSTLSPRQRATAIAWLPQQENLAWPLETRALVALGRLPHRTGLAPLKAADEEAIDAALARCNAADFAGRFVSTLSAGERARVLLARALATQAQILLADEPAAMLDPAHQLAVMATLKAEAQRGVNVMVVLHDLSLAARYCDRVLLIAQGGLAADGLPAEVLIEKTLTPVFRTGFHTGLHQDTPFVIPCPLP